MSNARLAHRARLRSNLIALSVAACFGLTSSQSFANPTGASGDTKTFSIGQSGNTLTITNTANAIINWQSFSIGVNEITRFIQSSASSAVLNRVVGVSGSAIPQSQIDGLLQSVLANGSVGGRVFLINPSGVVIGPTGHIDVAGFVASSLNLSDGDFLAGRMRFTATPGAGSVSNAGTIETGNAGPGGRVFLVAPDVQNSGIIRAPGGEIILAAGKSVELVSENSPFVTVSITADSEQALNLGQLLADSGRIGMYGALVRQAGVAEANGAVLGANGEIRLVATSSATLDAGSVTSASGGAQGGNVQVSAPVVVQAGDIRADGGAGGTIRIDATNFLQGGTLSASGSAGAGGAIAVNAPHVIQTESAAMSANGQGGDGGSIAVDASGAQDGLLFSSAKYSATGDKGGNIKLLGHDIVLLGASADASGANGGGTILVGGDSRGSNPAVANASTTGVNFSTTLKADATQNGDGGKIVVWSDSNTQFYGTASARGGAQSGNGGTMEISSGGDHLAMFGFADAGAPNGTPGSLLLDPKNIVIDSNTGGTGTLGFFQLLDPNPLAGNGFGTKVVVLPDQNVVVTAPNDNFGATGAGAVFLYNGTTGALISALTGSSANDHIGGAPTLPITTLPSGNFVVSSPQWNGNAGAVTFVNGTSGLTGAVSAVNSLVGSTTGDNVGQRVIDVLSTGNYVVSTPNWSNAGNVAAGAVTFVNGTNGNIGGTTSPGGAISATNSLVGTQLNDQVGNSSLVALNNGNYVVGSSNWANGTVTAAGAATLVNGTNGNIVGTTSPGGAVSAANSLVGTNPNDRIGSSFVQLVGNGANYIVRSPNWNGGIGAVTFGDGSAGVTGPVSASNSLVGTTAGDQVGGFRIELVGNGNYVVETPNWNGGMGAVTFGNGTTGGLTGTVSAANSLVGSTTTDQVGQQAITLLNNGNYVVRTPNWTNVANGTFQAGAATFGNGATGVTGAIDATNSLVGTATSDLVGGSVQALLNSGNYVVLSPNWSGGKGAATFVDGTNGHIGGTLSAGGTVSATNSLVGTTAGDSVGASIVELANGNYVVVSTTWTQPAPVATNVGAVTWVNGTNGNIFGTLSPGGTISAANSLVGVTASDSIGSNGVVALANGNYVVISPNWTNPQTTAVAAGAVTLVQGTGAAGQVTPANSLVGTAVDDQVGSNGIQELTNGNYVVKSPQWSNTLGAATLVNGANGNIASTGSPAGSVSQTNSLVGQTPGDEVGIFVTKLPNGNYVVGSPNWSNGVANPQAGAATFGDGTNGTVGVVTAANSLVGTTSGDQVGSFVQSLGNGNYVVQSPFWNNSTTGATQAGAVTFVNGTNGNIAGTGSPGGTVSNVNSLVGTTSNDQVGFQVVPIFTSSAGNYVVISPNWSNGKGAVTFGSGTTGVVGDVSSSNSLVGSTPDTTTTGDHVGSGFIAELPGGNYLVLSPDWNNGAATQAGAVTWVNGSNGNVFGQSIPGAIVSASNSLVGGTTGDQVGVRSNDCSSNCGGAQFLLDGNVALSTPFWSNPTTGAADAGAVTFINASTGIAGLISSANSIIGTTAGDDIGGGTNQQAGIIPLVNGNFIATSPNAANGAGLVHVVTPGASGGGAPATGQTFSANPSSDVTIAPASITAITNTGTALVLQANNDITLNPNSDIVSTATGTGGALTLQAGRSVVLNSSISSGGGAVTIVADESTSNGVINANRDPGAAVIAMAPGTIIKTGAADISLTLNDGAGLTNSTSGNITLGSLTTSGNVLVQNIGPTPGSGIVRSDAAQLVTAGSAAFVVNGAAGGGGIGTLAAPVRVSLANIAAQTQVGGAFFDSPLQGLTIGTAGNLNGITAAGAGGIGVSAAGPISIAQLVSSGTGAVKLASTATLSESGAGLISTGGTLTTVSAGGATLGGANTVNVLNATNTAGGDALFINSGTLTVTGVSEAGGNVTLSSTGAMTVAGPVSAGAGTVTLAATGAIAGSPSGSVQGGLVALNATGGAIGSSGTPLEVITPTLSAVAANGIAIDLNGFAPQPAVVNTLQNTASGDIVLTAHGGATFTSLVSNPSGSVTINSFSPLDVNAGITAGQNIFLSTNDGSSASNDMLLAGPYSYSTSGKFEVTIGVGGDLTLFSGTTPIVLTAPLFPNPINITQFTFVKDTASIGLDANTVIQATNQLAQTNTAPSAEDLNKKDKENKQKKEAVACK